MRVLSVVGARPQFVKAAALQRAYARLASGADVDEILVHTGQHYDVEMSQVFFDELGLRAPDVSLGVGSASHGVQTGEMLARLESVMRESDPTVVVVFGDTNTTLAGALAAVKLAIPVAHVEAGLRSGRRDMPEEINRVVTDHVSTLLFAPTETGVANLRSEGITNGVLNAGDVMRDVLEAQAASMGNADGRALAVGSTEVDAGSYALVTIHRAANTEPESLSAICGTLRQLAEEMPVVFPMHPRTRAAMPDDADLGSVRIVDPVGYAEMVRLESAARVIVTDSGGVQKEAFWLGVPCVTMRDETEWPETLAGGWNVLAGLDMGRVIAGATREPPERREPDALGPADASITIATAIERWSRSD